MSEKKFNRRTFLKGASMAVGGALLAACAPSAPAQPTTPADTNNPPQPTATAPLVVDPTAVTWWYAWGNLDAGIDAFTKTDNL